MRGRLSDATPEWIYDRIRHAAWIVLALGILAFLILGANRPANPRLLSPNAVIRQSGLSGFDAVRFQVAPGPGLKASARVACALVARTPTQQAQGLTGQTSLHGFAGMIFAFDPPTSTASFSTRDTLLPLSLAWFDTSGLFLAAVNMAPCPAAAAFCQTYRAGPPFKYAFEVPRGKLGTLGIGPGSILQLTGPCAG